MLNHVHSAQQQKAILPRRLPSYGRELGELIQAICEDRSFLPSERLRTLNVIWARTTQEQLKLKGPCFISTIAHRAAKLCREDPSARKAQHTEQLIIELARAAAKQFHYFKPQELANTAWAFAALGIRNETLLSSIAQEAANQSHYFNPQDCANTAWAFATLGIRNETLFSAIAREAAKKSPHFEPQGLANTAWAFATLGIRNETLFSAIAREAAKKSPHFDPQGLANTAWAFATLGIRNETLFSIIAQEAAKQSSHFNPQHLANTAWAFATLGIRNETLFSVIAREAAKKSPHFEPQGLANTAWAFAVDFPELVSSVVKSSILEHGGLDNTQWLQCYQALLVAGELSPSKSFPQYQRIIQAYQPEQMNRFEASVEAVLSELLITKQFTLSRGKIIAGVATDLAVEFNGRRILIECDGDKFHHSIGPDGGKPLGRDRLQDRLFELFGYEVVHIRDSEWMSQQHVSLLRSKLRIGVDLAG